MNSESQIYCLSVAYKRYSYSHSLKDNGPAVKTYIYPMHGINWNFNAETPTMFQFSPRSGLIYSISEKLTLYSPVSYKTQNSPLI